MKNLVISATPEPKAINLQDFPRLFSKQNVWKLFDKKSDIWYTNAIPGERMMPTSMLEDLYQSYSIYWLFGNYTYADGDDCVKVCAATRAVNMYDLLYGTILVKLSMNDVGTVYGEFYDDRRLISLGTILFADPCADVHKGLGTKIINCSDESPYIFDIPDMRFGTITNDPDDIFTRSDKPLEDAFIEEFCKLYHKYIITNRGGDIEDILKRIAKKLLY